jgi:serine/threonine-protein kinase HipA
VSLLLHVSVYGQQVGTLGRHKHGGVRFLPEKNWLQRGQLPPLGFAFLSDPSPRLAQGTLPPWFENLLPEAGSALRGWICRQQEIRETDSAALLVALGEDLPGAVEITGRMNAGSGSAPESTCNSNYDHPGEFRFSLAGMQLKMSMLLRGDRFALPMRGEVGSWIVKIPGERFPELPEVENASMAWAHASGLSTPPCRVVPMEELQGVEQALLGNFPTVFAVERFDRSPEGRIHQEDFAQALEIRPMEKYGEGPHGVSYDGLTRLVRDACGQDVQAEFLRRLAFVVASGNGDAHLKNWTFQWGRKHRVWLSPCYDQVATISWPAEDGWEVRGGPRLALSIGRTRRFRELERKHIRVLTERGRAPNGEDVFMSGLEMARSAWNSVKDRAPVRMREAVKKHWNSVPLLRELGGL